MKLLRAVLVVPCLLPAPAPRSVFADDYDPVRGAEQSTWAIPAEPPLPVWPRLHPPVETHDPWVNADDVSAHAKGGAPRR